MGKPLQPFKGINFVNFVDHFDSDDKCYQYLANIKWRDGFVCKKCGHTTYV